MLGALHMISFILTSWRMIKAFFRAFKDKDFQALLLLTAIILFSGMMFYSSVEGWSKIDALYYSSMVLTTVGVPNLAPETDFGKIFTIIYLFSGIGVIFGFVRVIAEHVRKKD